MHPPREGVFCLVCFLGSDVLNWGWGWGVGGGRGVPLVNQESQEETLGEGQRE